MCEKEKYVKSPLDEMIDAITCPPDVGPRLTKCCSRHPAKKIARKKRLVVGHERCRELYLETIRL